MYQLIRSNRKTLALEVKPDLSLVVRAPAWVELDDIDRFVFGKAEWIAKHTRQMEQRGTYAPEALTQVEIDALCRAAREKLPERVRYYSQIMGVTPTRLTITHAKTRYGSCSARNALCFSYLLMCKPDDLIDYVVVHELAHIVQKNHGPAFYALIARWMPDYQARQRRLRHG
ncbi:MAG: SprT family zinc-dependent metalloprotease [Clostridia bacterium]